MTFEGTDLGLGAARACSLLRPSRAHRSLACDALHRASADAERSGDLQDTHTFRKLPSHLPLGCAVDLRSAELHALGERALEPSFDALADHRPLKLGKGAG